MTAPRSRPACLECDRPLSSAELARCARCRHVLWDRAPLPPGHPAGTRGRDLRDPEQTELPLGP